MSPSLPSKDVANSGLTYTELMADRFVSAPFLEKGSDLNDLVFNKFGRSRSASIGRDPPAVFDGLPKSFSSRSSSLCITVGIIVRFGPKKKMVWIDAGPVVASVKNAQVVGDRAVAIHPGSAVGLPSSAFDFYSAIAVINRPRPYDASCFRIQPRTSSQSFLDREIAPRQRVSNFAHPAIMPPSL